MRTNLPVTNVEYPITEETLIVLEYFDLNGRLYGGFGALLLFCVGLAGFAVMQLGELAPRSRR